MNPETLAPLIQQETELPRTTNAAREFRRILGWIALVAVLMVAGALTFLALTGGLTFHMAIATIAGVFLSTVLGCGLFALAFFSDKSGHDERASRSTRRGDADDPPSTP